MLMFVLSLFPADVPVQIVFDEGVGSSVREAVVESWAAVSSELLEVAEPDFSVPSVWLTARSVVQVREQFEQVSDFATFVSLGLDGGALAQERLTVEVTLHMLRQWSGKASLFHAAALGDESSKRAVILIGPSGRGKTTAARFLGQHFVYLSDETAVVCRDFSMRPYPKPLSVIVDPTLPKQQLSPISAGLRAALPGDHSYRLSSIILLNRVAHVGGQPLKPRLERVGLVDTLLTVVSETSGLETTPAGLGGFAEIVRHCGGALQLTYSEVSDTLPVFEGIFSGSTDLGSYVEEELVVVSHEGGMDGVAQGKLCRQPGSHAVFVEERSLLMQADVLMEVSELAFEVWMRLEDPLSEAELRASLVRDFGEVDDSDFAVFMQTLLEAKIICRS